MSFDVASPKNLSRALVSPLAPALPRICVLIEVHPVVLDRTAQPTPAELTARDLH
jgi:hypothetical protein